MKRDILKEIHEGTLSVEEADAIYDSIGEPAGPPHAHDLLGLSPAESTAFGIVGFDELARWRYSGWPNVCPVCGQEIAVEKFGWWPKEVDGRHRLVHISCLPGPTEEEKQLRSEFQKHAVPCFYNYFEREAALRFVERANQINLAVALVYGLIIRDAKVLEAPRELLCSCWDKVPGETWEEFREQCKACAQDFLRTVPPQEGLAFDLEIHPQEKWPQLRSRRAEIQEERRRSGCGRE
jgi:hypothetical protein